MSILDDIRNCVLNGGNEAITNLIIQAIEKRNDIASIYLQGLYPAIEQIEDRLYRQELDIFQIYAPCWTYKYGLHCLKAVVHGGNRWFNTSVSILDITGYHDHLMHGFIEQLLLLSHCDFQYISPKIETPDFVKEVEMSRSSIVIILDPESCAGECDRFKFALKPLNFHYEHNLLLPYPHPTQYQIMFLAKEYEEPPGLKYLLRYHQLPRTIKTAYQSKPLLLLENQPASAKLT
jgi:hypothetical protein